MKEGGWLDKFAPVDKAAAKEYARRQTSLSADNTTPELRKVNRENARKENFISNSPFTQSLAAMSPNHNPIIGRLAAESITEANPLMSAVRLTNSIKDPANNSYGMGKGKGAVQNALGFLGAVGDISDFGNILSPALSNIKRVGKTAKSAIKQSKEALPSYYPDDLFIPDKPYDTKAERIDRVRHAFWNSNRNENNSLSPEDLKVINNNGIGNRQLYTGAPFSNLSTYYVDDLRDIFRSGKRPITPREMAVLNERGVRYESPPAPTIPPMYGLTNGPSNITPSPAGGLFGMTAEQTNAAWADVNNRINTFNWNDLTTSTSLRGRLDQRIQSALGMNTPRNFITSSRPSQSLLQSLGESIYTGLGGSRRSDNQYVPFSQLVAEQNAGRGLFNRSGFTKQQILNSPEFTDKKALSEMSDEDFIHTVFTPSGQVARYESSVAPHLFTGDNEITPLTSIEYADAFNSRLDLLNDIIAKNNKSGVGYRVKGIDSNGKLTFHTPKQIKRWQDDPYKVASIENLEKLKNDPVELQKRLHGEMLTLEDFDGIINSLKEDKIIAPEGESSWNTRINPGEWRGTVENFPSREYYESIPGLKMAGTTSGVFSDGIVRKGSGAYKSVNEYLKTLDLGRVKAGFNSQSKESRGLWESYVKKGTAAGHWGDPFTVHGVMKKNGGWLDKYEDGGELNYNDSSVSAPEGFEGDGYSNVGRDYSPAWGGQFKDGGPIYTTNPKDPRLQAYKDSSILYNNYVKQYSAKGKNRPLTKEEIKLAIEQRENPRANYPNTKVLNVKGSNKVKKYHYSDSSGAYNAELVDDMFHPVIKPIGSYLYSDDNFWNTNINNIYKKPTQPVIYQKPEPTPQSIIDFMEGNYAQEPITEIPQSQASAYGEVVDPRTGYTHMTRQGSAMYPMVGQNVPEMEEGGPVKRFMQPTETFKNYGYNPKTNGMSTELSTSIGGPGEVYLVPGYRQGRILQDPEGVFNAYGEHLGGPFKTVKAAEDFGKLRHKYVEKNQNIPAPIKTRDYAMGGSLPGSVGFMYARTNDPAPSNGKYAKKTKASAQNGTEMEYYQNGLDWKPRSMAEGGEVVPGENEELQIPSAWDDKMAFIKNNPRLRGTTRGGTPRFMPPQLLDEDQFEFEDVNYDQAALKHFVNSLTTVESKNYIPKMEDKFDTMENMYYTKSTKFDEDWSKLNSLDESSNKIKLNTGRFRGAKVPTNIIDELAKTSRKQNVPLGQLLTLMGRESMFGSGTDRNEDRAGSKTSLMSGWNVAEDYQPYNNIRFLADNKVPGVKPTPTPHGYEYEITDERAMNNYLRKNPKLLDQYKAKLDSTKVLGDQDAFDLAAKFLKKKGVKGYNPGDPKYTEAFNQDYNLLKQDKGLMKYVKQKGYTFEDGGSLELTKLDQLTNFTNYNTKQPGGWLDKYES
jgi:hypothetical protein